LPIPELILITDTSRMDRERFFEAVEASLCGGVDAVLVREKQMDSAHLLAFCSRLRAITADHGARLIVHGQADVAKAVEADGVHVAARDIEEIPVMRQWLDHAGMTVSASCHDADELNDAAEAGADFALLSPVFPTASHPSALHLGTHRFRTLVDKAQLPVIVLGGITTENRKTLAGFGVAVISAILESDDPELAARQLHEGSTRL